MGQVNVARRVDSMVAAPPRVHRNKIYVVVFAADAVVITSVALLALTLRSEMRMFGPTPGLESLILPVMWLVIVVWLLALLSVGAYRQKHLGAGTAEYRTVLQGSLLTAGLVGISAYLADYPLSRAYFFVVFLLGIPTLLVTRFVIRRVLHAVWKRGMFRTPMLVAGSPWHIDYLAQVLNRERWLGYDLVGALVPEGEDRPKAPLPVLGTPDDVLSAIRSTNAAAVIFVEGAFREPHHFNLLARELELEKARLIVIPALAEIASNRIDVQTVAGLPLLTVAKPQAQRAGRGLKRSFDLALAGAALILASPVLLVAALAVKLEDGGPVIYRQPRVGRHSTVFNCLKLRSMVPNADQLRSRLEANENDGDGVLFKLRKDPRVTRVGRFIRRYSIDELPQLVNVIKGEMSLIGPRPALESEVSKYQRHVLRRLDVRPGITGLWQVSGRSDLSWDDAVRLDLYYVDNWSFVQDLGILFRTVQAVLKSDGAY